MVHPSCCHGDSQRLMHVTVLQERGRMLSQMCCSVATVTAPEGWRATDIPFTPVYKKPKQEISTQANKLIRQPLDSLPCLTTPLALRLGSGPTVEKREQIITNLYTVLVPVWLLVVRCVLTTSLTWNDVFRGLVRSLFILKSHFPT